MLHRDEKDDGKPEEDCGGEGEGAPHGGPERLEEADQRSRDAVPHAARGKAGAAPAQGATQPRKAAAEADACAPEASPAAPAAPDHGVLGRARGLFHPPMIRWTGALPAASPAIFTANHLGVLALASPPAGYGGAGAAQLASGAAKEVLIREAGDQKAVREHAQILMPPPF